MKRLVAFFIAILFVISTAYAGQNLIHNNGFEEQNLEGLASNFYTDAYQDPSFTTNFKLSTNSHSGNFSACIRNVSPNDARFIQTLAVEPDTYYKLSGYIMAENIDGGKGANLSIEGVYSFTKPIYNTNGQWEYVELYGKTGKNQKELSIYARLGGYSGESKGIAYFDDIALEKLDEAVEEYDIWHPTENKPTKQEETDNLNRGTIFLALLGYLALAYIVLRFINDKKIKHSNLYIIIVLTVAFLSRVILAISTYGHGIDMNCFIAWASQLAKHGISDFYSNTGFCDYPPGYMYVLYLNGKIFSNTHMSGQPIWLMYLNGIIFNDNHIVSRFIWLVTKFVPICCDILTALLLYKIANKKQLNGFAIATLYVFNPLVIITSALWGQIDSVFTLLILIAAYLLLAKKIQYAIPVYTLSCLVKPQGLMFGPVALVYLISIAKDKSIIRKSLIGIAIAVIVFLIIVLPFTPSSSSLSWIVEKYSETLSSYEYATINTTNVFYLMDANWAPQTGTMPIWFAISYGIVLILLSVILLKTYFHSFKGVLKQKLATILMLAYTLLFIAIYIINPSYIAFSTLNVVSIIVLSIIFIFVLQKDRIAYILALSLLSMYCMTVRMHERYVFAAIALFMLDYAYSKNIKSLIMGLLASIATYINVAIILDNTIVLGVTLGHLRPDTKLICMILSICNILVMSLGIYFGFSSNKAKTSKKHNDTSIAEQHLKFKKHIFIDKRDMVIMFAISLVYSLFAFYKLGSTVSPQTMFTSSSPGESVVFELENDTEFNVLYYGGINYNTVKFSTSEDGINFTEEYPAELNQSQIFKWKYLCDSSDDGGDTPKFSHTPIALSGKYLKMKADEAGVNICEIILRRPSVNGVAGKTIHIKPVKHESYETEFSNTPIEYLCDEPNSLVGEPSYFNSTYFDEIYHPRTAYEFIHGIRPYETSHPPLGKLFMSLGILIFGMTPFGYRFFGVLAGVIMLPCIYVIAKYLFDNKKLASSACLLFAMDLMHLAQTRIATIDSYPVLFIMLSFMFMLKYIQLNHFAMKIQHTYTPLLLSGIFFGLSVASKWIGMYAGLGLAIMFFTSQFMQMRAGSIAQSRLTDKSPSIEREAANTYKYRFIQTCAHCIIYFIFIPSIIYFVCYIPYFASTGGITLSKLIDAQIGMFKYHSKAGLGMDHPFYSPWWQWPFILKPMWYYLGYYEPSGMSETIYCMGNPAIFYTCALTMLATILIFIVKLIKKSNDNILVCFALSIGFLSQYLPWVLVPRGTYIYHYFASVPFIILSAMYIFYLAYKKFKSYRKFIDVILIIFLLVSLATFIGFYPYATGILTSNKWLDAMRWFKGIGY